MAASSARDQRTDAVLVREATLEYGTGSNRVTVLNGVDMTVPTGVIYALLGPSGCGKTCLLNCILRLLTPNKGYVEVFGSEEQLPGSWVGYMPQDLHLYTELTIEETLRYFGSLNGMTKAQLTLRIPTVLELLGLHGQCRCVGSLSGGQQRRISLAVAMIHKPRLLVLDEPTVGLDPALRTLIWAYIIQLVKDVGSTVLLTTHQVDEVRGVNIVGFMRKGRILVERNPSKLMKEHGSPSMEIIFTTLSLRDESDCRGDRTNELCYVNSGYKEEEEEACSTTNFKGTGELVLPATSASQNQVTTESNGCRFPYPERGRSMAKHHWTQVATVTLKNIHRLKRNAHFLFAVIFLPVVVLFMMRTLLGHDLTELPLAIINKESSSIINRSFLEKVSHRTIILREFSCFGEALDSVQRGHAVGILVIGENFTDSLTKRLLDGRKASQEVIQNGKVRLIMASGNSMVISAVYRALMEAVDLLLKELATTIATNIRSNIRVVDIKNLTSHFIYNAETKAGNTAGYLKVGPVSIERGPRSFSEVLAAGWACGVIYVIGLGASCLTFVPELESGLLDRSMVAGLTKSQLVTSQLMMQLPVSLVHVLSAALLVTSGRGVTMAACVLLWPNLMGVAHGLILSWLTRSTLATLVILTALQAIDYCISGISWPIESVPYWAQQVIYVVSPVAVSAQALRMILFRDASLHNPFLRFSFFLDISRTLTSYVILILVIWRCKR